MKKSQRIMSLAAAVLMAFSCVPTAAVDTFAYADNTVYDAGGFSKKEIALMNKMKELITNYDGSEVDIEDYNLSCDDLWVLYNTVIYNEPTLYQAHPGSIYVDYETEDHVESFAINFRYNERRKSAMQEEVDEFVDELMAGVRDEWTDAEKVLYVHDYIAAECDYYSGKSNLKGRNIYEAFVKGSSVCVGYAMGFQYIMDLLDIPCMCVTSETHIWNMVKVGENWYHVDVTWDDPEKITENLVFHEMLLLSEYALDNYSEPHEPWDYGMTADSNKYDKFFWQDSTSQMIYSDNYWYYTDMGGLCRYSFKTGKEELLYKYTEDDVWKADPGKYWSISFGQVCEAGGKIYFNTSEKIKCYDPKTGKTSAACSPKLQNGQQIFDISLEDGKLLIYAGTGIDNTAEKTFSFDLSK
ncbi:MAG: hypothetical protein K2N72_01535 [Oscillospiraceae bacterium]|nr:hypothetical protein [Oscillospiraceae bacterium]